MATQIGCLFCNSPLCAILSQQGDRTSFKCEVCGCYDVSSSALRGKLDPERHELSAIQRAILSHRIREANIAGRLPPLMTTYEIDDVIATGRLPTPAQQAINIIRFVGDLTAASGKPVRQLLPHFHASVGSPNRDFALRIAKQLVRAGVLDAVDCAEMHSPNEIMEVDLTLHGWERYEAEQRGQLSGNYGFMALQFGDAALDSFFTDVIKPAVSSIGFELVDMRDTAEAGIIDNVMRVRIRDAAFVLVDLTHANQNAYWEAGYAEGLGKPVLYICNRQTFEESGTHFDANHCTTVLWDSTDPETFTKDLIATLRRSLRLFEQ